MKRSQSSGLRWQTRQTFFWNFFFRLSAWSFFCVDGGAGLSHRISRWPSLVLGASVCRTSRPLRKASKLTSKNSVMSKWCQEPSGPSGTGIGIGWIPWALEAIRIRGLTCLALTLPWWMRSGGCWKLGRGATLSCTIDYIDHQWVHDRLAICFGYVYVYIYIYIYYDLGQPANLRIH